VRVVDIDNVKQAAAKCRNPLADGDDVSHPVEERRRISLLVGDINRSIAELPVVDNRREEHARMRDRKSGVLIR
jgi:hypothetical protein